MAKNEFARKLAADEAVVGIVGLGYVGIPLALRFSTVGFRVLGFDIDADRVAALNAGKSPIKHISSESIGRMVAKGFEATADFSRIPDVDRAEEMVKYTRAPPLSQAGTSMLAQANQSTQGVLSLLR